MITLHTDDLVDWIEAQRRGPIDIRTDAVLSALLEAVHGQDQILEYRGEIDSLNHQVHAADRDCRYWQARIRDIRARCAAVGFDPLIPLPRGFMP